MMSEREVWLKAMAVVQAHGTIEAVSVMGTLIEMLGGESDQDDWLRVAAAVDAINDGEPQ